jgi:hypothetical protein
LIRNFYAICPELLPANSPGILDMFDPLMDKTKIMPAILLTKKDGQEFLPDRQTN